VNGAAIEALVEKVRSFPDPAARDTSLELVQAVMDLHAAGIERMMEVISSAENRDALFDRFADDPAVSCVLLLHDAHPLDLEARVRRALNSLSMKGAARAELVTIRDGVVRVRVEGGQAIALAVREALGEGAPDALEIVIEGEQTFSSGFVPLERLVARPAH
jgi:hypothetical protein